MEHQEWLKSMAAVAALKRGLAEVEVDLILRAFSSQVMRSGIADKSKEELEKGFEMAADIVAAERKPAAPVFAVGQELLLANYDCSPTARVLTQNRERVLAALAAVGAASAECRYAGGGDEGQMDEVEIRGADGSIIECDDASVTLLTLTHQGLFGERGQPGSGHKYMVKECEHTLQEALEELCWDAVAAAGHSGWENNDGGFGELKFDVAKASMNLEHSDYYTESNTSYYDFSKGGDDDPGASSEALQ